MEKMSADSLSGLRQSMPATAVAEGDQEPTKDIEEQSPR